MKVFIKHAVTKVCVIRSLKVSFLVGTILALINHYDAIFMGNLNSLKVFQILLTYLVPYSVSTFSSAMQSRYVELSQIKRI